MPTTFTDDPPAGSDRPACDYPFTDVTGSCLSVHPDMVDIQSVLAAVGSQKPPADLAERIKNACCDLEPAAEIGCEQCLQQASAYLDDELSVPERDAFEAHLFLCATCYAAFRRMERIAEVLRETPAARAPAALHERISAAVAREAAAASEPAFTWRRAAAVVGGLAAAAALLAAVFIPRGNAGLPAGDAIVADAPPAVVAESVDDAPAPAEAMMVEEPVVEPDAPVVSAEAPAVAPASPVARTRPSQRPETRVAAAVTEPASEPASPRSTPAEADERAPAGESGTPLRLQPERRTPPRGSDSTRPAPPSVRHAPPPAPAPEPVIAEERPIRAPIAGGTPVISSPAPAREAPARETEIVAISTPRPAGATPVTAVAPAATRTGTATPAAGDERPQRLVPQQGRSREVFRAEEAVASPGVRSRMAERINGSVGRLDNPTSGIALN